MPVVPSPSGPLDVLSLSTTSMISWDPPPQDLFAFGHISIQMTPVCVYQEEVNERRSAGMPYQRCPGRAPILIPLENANGSFNMPILTPVFSALRSIDYLTAKLLLFTCFAICYLYLLYDRCFP